MKLFIIIWFTVTLCKALQHQRRQFPEDFLFGTSTAFYEIGDRNAEGTTEIWESPKQNKSDVIRDKRNGDNDSNGHTNYKQDVEMMTELGLNACRLSLSWSRLLPNGLSNKVNHDGVAFYNNYINEMINHNITPIVILYNNMGLPQNLKDRGGLINPLYPEWFEEYARFAYKTFGDRVKYWITFNDPKETCYNGYGYDTISPASNATDVKTYYCAKNLVMAHARAYYAYVKDFKPSQGGFCGIMINVDWFEPLSDSTEDRFAAEIKRQAEWGIFAEPIFSKYGGFPKELFASAAKKSAQGFRSRMPEFTKEEREFVKGSSDFFGVNHYAARLVSTEEQIRHYTVPSLHTDADFQTNPSRNWQNSVSSQFRTVPNSLLNVVTHLQKKYNNPIMYVAENDWPRQENSERDDDFRIKYYKDALNSVLDALEAGVDLRGFIASSLLTNFERTERYLEQLGLEKVHFDCKLKLHIPRKSAFVYKRIIKTRAIDTNYKPDIFTTWIDKSLAECLSREINKYPEVHRKLCQHQQSQSSTGILSDDIRSILTAACRDGKRQKRLFSDDFLFGVSTASYQIEGGWNADDKSENIWDHLTHTKPDFIRGRSNGDIAADTYTNYKRDVETLRELGVNVYRFSLSWTRILPNGFSNKVSQAGIRFYNNYINEMLKYNIKPIVALYHFDMPQKLQGFGGLMNPLFAEWFEDYVRVAFKHFGDRVKHWITFNEPKEICHNGYGSGTLAPALNATDVGTYYCAKNLAIAHAKAYHAYVKDFKQRQGGVCGITVSFNWLEPLTDSEEDRFVAEILRQSHWNLFTDPIFSEHGGFPKELSEFVANKSLAEGYVKSRMPAFTDEERELVRGSADFFGVNHYTAHLVSATEYKRDYPEFSNEVDVGIYAPPEWPRSALYWLTFAPKSLFKTVTYIQKKYNSPIIYITENGWPQPTDEELEDNSRVTYIRAALNDVLDALEAGVDIRGYMVWSLMDNFEWEEGYTQRFGLYEVDFNSQSKTRTPRKSAFVYKHIIKSRVIDQGYEPKNLTMWIDRDH